MTAMELLRTLFGIGPEFTDHQVVALVYERQVTLEAELRAQNKFWDLGE